MIRSVRLPLSYFLANDLRRDFSKIRTGDVRLRTERIEDLPRSRYESCGTSGPKRTHDIPRMRRHESSTENGRSKRRSARRWSAAAGPPQVRSWSA